MALLPAFNHPSPVSIRILAKACPAHNAMPFRGQLRGSPGSTFLAAFAKILIKFPE
jgi:hypothetical protein